MRNCSIIITVSNPETTDCNEPDTFLATKGAILEIVVASNKVSSINVSRSISPPVGANDYGAISQSFAGSGYNTGDKLQLLIHYFHYINLLLLQKG